MWKGIPFITNKSTVRSFIVIILLVPFVPQIAPFLMMLQAVFKPLAFGIYFTTAGTFYMALWTFLLSCKRCPETDLHHRRLVRFTTGSYKRTQHEFVFFSFMIFQDTWFVEDPWSGQVGLYSWICKSRQQNLEDTFRPSQSFLNRLYNPKSRQEVHCLVIYHALLHLRTPVNWIKSNILHTREFWN